MKWLRRRLLNPRQSEQWRERLDADLLSAVLLARVIPGLRFVTYSACGFVQVALPAFCVGVMLAVITWTAGLFALCALSGQALADTLGVSPTWAALVPVAVLALSSMIWRKSQST